MTENKISLESYRLSDKCWAGFCSELLAESIDVDFVTVSGFASLACLNWSADAIFNSPYCGNQLSITGQTALPAGPRPLEDNFRKTIVIGTKLRSFGVLVQHFCHLFT